MGDSTTDWRARAEAAEARVVRVASLEKQVADLIARLSQDSSNSHRPPSTDRSGRRQRRKKEGSGRKPGGHPGHKGLHRALLPESGVDDVVRLRAESCRCCGAALDGRPAQGEPMRYQQAELPPIRPVITAFEAERVQCGCGSVNAPPVRRDQTGCTGPRMIATIATLAGRYRLARAETTGLLRDLLGVELSEGTIQTICVRVSGAAAVPIDELEAALPSVPQLFMDQAGWKQHGVWLWLWLWLWLWTASTARFAVSAIHRRRSSAQVRAWLPNDARGVVRADRRSAYSHREPARR